MRYTYNDVKTFIESKKCILLSKEYENSTKSLQIQCLCGCVFLTTFARFKNQNKIKCDGCSGFRYSEEYIKKYLTTQNVRIYNIEILSKNRSNITIQCECGNIFKTTFNSYINKNKTICNKCSIGRENSTFLTTEYVLKYLKQYDLELISEYINSTAKINIKCVCGEIFKTSFNKIKNSNKIRCNKCTKSMSKIEILSEKFFIENNIRVASQYMFKDLKTTIRTYLKFDFAILDNKDNIICLIELDGKQHFEPVELWGGDAQLLINKKNDKMKNDYCDKKGIVLFRIPYYKFNKINEELNKILKKVNLVPSPVLMGKV